MEEITVTNIKYWKKVGLKITERDQTFPITYLLPKMQNTPIGGARFIVASKNCHTKPLSDLICKVLKMIFNRVKNFHRKGVFYTCSKIFWVVVNLFSVATKLNKINTKKKAKSISFFNIIMLDTIILHNFLISVLSQVLFSNEKLEVALAF